VGGTFVEKVTPSPSGLVGTLAFWATRRAVLHNLAHLAFGIGILAVRKHATALVPAGRRHRLRGAVPRRDPRRDGLAPADDTDDWLHLGFAIALPGAWLAAKNEDERVVRTV
jgi:hypothetical protein